MKNFTPNFAVSEPQRAATRVRRVAIGTGTARFRLMMARRLPSPVACRRTQQLPSSLTRPPYLRFTIGDDLTHTKNRAYIAPVRSRVLQEDTGPSRFAFQRGRSVGAASHRVIPALCSPCPRFLTAALSYPGRVGLGDDDDTGADGRLAEPSRLSNQRPQASCSPKGKLSTQTYPTNAQSLSVFSLPLLRDVYQRAARPSCAFLRYSPASRLSGAMPYCSTSSRESLDTTWQAAAEDCPPPPRRMQSHQSVDAALRAVASYAARSSHQTPQGKHLLNAEDWRFKLYDSPCDVPMAFYGAGFDDSSWALVHPPLCPPTLPQLPPPTVLR